MVKKPLSLATRSLILRLRQQSHYSISQLAKTFKCHRNTITNLLRLHHTHHSLQPRRRSGRPRKLSQHDERALRMALRNNPSATTKEATRYLSRHRNKHVSTRTVERERRRLGFHPVSEVIDIQLTEQHKHDRVQFCLNNKLTNWKLVMFSDEKSFTLGGTHNRLWIEAGTQIPRREVKQKVYSCMVWGCIWYQGRSTLSITTGSINSKRYCEVLEEHLLPVYPNQSFLFQQDNAKIHIAKNTLNFLSEFGVSVLADFPPYSPELNPIELVWSHMSHIVNSQSPTSPQELQDAIQHAWDEIPQSEIQHYIDHLPSILTKIIDQQGERA
jgi:transposase